MTATQSIRLYELSFQMFKDEAKAKEFVGKIEETVDNKFEQKKSELATKEDIHLLKEDLANFKGDLRGEIKESKVEMIKWLVSIFIAIALMIFGLY